MRHGAVVGALLGALLAGGASGGAGERGGDGDGSSEAFSLVVLGDRSLDRARGVEAFGRLIETASGFDPDFVVGVGAAVSEGADAAASGGAAAAEASALGNLGAPWYGVGGTDGGGRASFTHKFAHCVLLGMGEGEGESIAAWLRSDLAAARAERVLVFTDRAGWLGDAGAWGPVHAVLAADGRPVTVFGGGARNLRDDGTRDGVRYLTVGPAGGDRIGSLAGSSFDHATLVRVRPDRVSVVVVPAGSVRSVEAYPGEESDEVALLGSGAWVAVEGRAAIGETAGASSRVRAVLTNPTGRVLDVSLGCDAPAGWVVTPRDGRVTLGPGERLAWEFDLTAPALGSGRPGVAFRARALYPRAAGSSEGVSVRVDVPVDAALGAEAAAGGGSGGYLRLNGRSAVRVDLAETPGAFTLELWARGAPPRGRQGLACNTEGSGFGIFWSDRADGEALPAGFVHAGGSYAGAGASEPWDFARWTHLAMTYDGSVVRFFVGGRPVGEARAEGPVTPNRLPLMIGADVDGSGRAESFWTGDLDSVRLSAGVRYEGAFEPECWWTPDGDTLLQMGFDRDLGPVFADASGRGLHGWAVGSPEVVFEDRHD